MGQYYSLFNPRFQEDEKICEICGTTDIKFRAYFSHRGYGNVFFTCINNHEFAISRMASYKDIKFPLF